MLLGRLVILTSVDSADILLVRWIVDEVLRKKTVLGSGVVSHQLLCDGVDPVGGNDIAGKDLAGFRGRVVSRGIVDRAGEGGEIAGSHRDGGDRVVHRRRLPPLERLPAEKEEHLVFLDRSAEGEAVVVPLERGFASRVEEVPGVQFLVAEKVVRRAVKPVRARLVSGSRRLLRPGRIRRSTRWSGP